MSEAKIKGEIQSYLRALPNFAMFPIYTGATRGGRTVNRRGTPDIVGCYLGRFIGIEVKTPQGTQSPAQKEIEKEIVACGGVYIVARSLQDIEDLINSLRS